MTDPQGELVTTAPNVDAQGSGRLSDEARQLIEDNVPLVRHVLYQVATHYPRHADREELAQAAALGLVEAAARFDAARGVPFERWASVRVRGAIVDAVRALDFAPRSLRAAARETDTARQAVQARLGRVPTATEIAEEMGISTRELHDLESKLHRALVLSLDAPCGEDDGDPLTLGDNLVESSDVDPAHILEERELSRYLGDALQLLPDRLRTVISGYFLEGRTSSDIAQELGVTESRVSQMRSEALGLMRAGLSAQFGADQAPAQAPAPARSKAAYRQAAYASALAAQSSYAARLSRLPAQRVAPAAEQWSADLGQISVSA
jgi:RNA polymerase sigma factor for flagellar operon FliA